MNPLSSEESRWFAEEVQPHEPALRAYLHARFPALSDQDDVVQEAYTRLFRAKQSGKLRFAKAFLFTASRNLALDFFRRRRANFTETITDFHESTVLGDRPSAAEIVNQQQELEILAEAVQALPDRCRQVILLRFMDGLSYKEIAQRMNISSETVKVQLAKGTRRCAEYFQERGLVRPKTPSQDQTMP